MKTRTTCLVVTAAIVLFFGYLLFRSLRSERGEKIADRGADACIVDGGTGDATAFGAHRMGVAASPPCYLYADGGLVADVAVLLDAGTLEGGIFCSGICRNSHTDNNNCGTCGTVCPCGASWNYCENCTNGGCCIAKGSICQYAPGGACCDGSTCAISPSGYSTCQ